MRAQDDGASCSVSCGPLVFSPLVGIAAAGAYALLADVAYSWSLAWGLTLALVAGVMVVALGRLALKGEA